MLTLEATKFDAFKRSNQKHGLFKTELNLRFGISFLTAGKETAAEKVEIQNLKFD